MSVSGYALRDADGVVQATLINRGVSFYEGETHRLNADGTTTKLELPAKSSINALVRGQMVVTTDQDWTAPSGQAFRTGDVIAWDLNRWLADPATPAQLVIRPSEREAIEGITATRNKLVVALYENVRGGVYVYEPNASGEWARTRLDLPQNVIVGVGSASERDDRVFVSVTGYLNPSSLYLADAATGAADVTKTLPAKFDAAGMTVEQFEARSADGTMIPYFVVHKGDMADGRVEPDPAVRLRRLPEVAAARLFGHGRQAVAGAGRRLCRRQHPRRRRVRPALAPGGAAGEPPAVARGLPGRGAWT